MKPFLTWTGSKYRLLDHIRKYYPDEFNRYYEPFLGSASVYFDLVSENRISDRSSVYLSDCNPSLCSTYIGIQRNSSEVWRLHKEIIRNHELAKDSKAFFNEVKTTQRWKLEEIAAAFLYINKACISGIYRENSTGGINVTCRSGKISFLDIEVYQQCALALQKVNISCQSFQTAIRDATTDDFIYFDPPYQSWNDKGTRAIYNASNFTFNHQRELRDLCIDLDSRGVKFLLSNSASERIYSMFEDNFNIIEFPVEYNLGTGRKAEKTKEVLIMNY